MNQLNSFLHVFKNFLQKETAVRIITQEVIYQLVGITIPVSDIQVRDGVIVLKKITPLVKSGLLMRREEILKEISQKTQRVFTDLR